MLQIKINYLDQMGYYRVNYDGDTWLQLSGSLSSLSNINRAGLIDDALNLARAGQLGYVQCWTSWTTYKALDS
jgi:aminopeptidase N